LYTIFIPLNVCSSHSRNGAPNGEVEKYIDKISVLEDKYELLMELKNYTKAMEVASKLKDPYRLQDVSRCSILTVLVHIDEVLQ
jgi:hypothetical protein